MTFLAIVDSFDVSQKVSTKPDQLHGHYSSIDVLLHITEQRMLAEGLVRHGELIAFTTGMPVGASGTNLLKIHRIP